ncbi:MAG: DUF1440 domain-containing protein [Acidobacteria bacterium]|nr:DUF1440 domain-containing protein [Acidobacteriota bacterium]
MQNHDGELWKGAVAGLAAGLAATYVMTQFQNLSGKLAKALEEDEPQNPQHAADRGKEEGGQRDGQQEEDATVKTAEAISHGLFHHELTREEKKVAGPAVHYGFGTLTGGAYGALAEVAPAVTRGAGLPFGSAVWLGADEIAVPAFRLSGPPLSHPPAVHARALAAHLVYGLALETARRLVRRVL